MNGEDDAEEQLVRALEKAPAVPIPDDFAARVMARIPHQPRRGYVLRGSFRKSRLGSLLLLMAMLVLVAGMLLAAPYTKDSSTWLILQGLLFAQLAALLLWVGLSGEWVL